MKSAKRNRSARQTQAMQCLSDGAAALNSGERGLALELFRKAIRLDKRNALAHSNLATVLRGDDRMDEAQAAFGEALRLQPDNSVLHYNLAICQEKMGLNLEAEQSYRQAISLDPDLASAYSNLGLMLARIGRRDEAIGPLRKAVGLSPRDMIRRRNLRSTLSDLVPTWHFNMMNDVGRNKAYEAAILRAVKPGMTVLDIGAGSGLLSMMAVRAGAGHVYAFEMVPAIAEKTVAIVNRNGMSDRITVLPMKSTDARIGRDIPVRGDLVISEILSSEVIGEEIVSSLRHAHEQLLRTGAQSVPQAAEAWTFLVGGTDFGTHYFVAEQSGFDLSPFNGLRPEIASVKFQDHDFEALSEPLCVLRIDYPFDQPIQAKSKHRYRVTGNGLCFGIGQWISVDLDEAGKFANDPRLDVTHPSSWQHIFYAFEDPMKLCVGDIVDLTCLNTGTKLIFDFPIRHPAK